MAAPITANTITITQQAQRVFVQNMEDLAKVQDTLSSALSQLTNTGMNPLPLSQITSSLQQFYCTLDDIISMSQWMAETLGKTWQMIQKNEEDNTDLAAGVTVQPEPKADRIEASLGGDTTVAPGQTIDIRVKDQGPLL